MGSYGATRGAAMATERKVTITAAEIVPSHFRLASWTVRSSRRACSAEIHGRLNSSVWAGAAIRAASLPIPNAWIEPAVAEIHQQVHQDEHERQEQNVDLELRHVSMLDRVEC